MEEQGVQVMINACWWQPCCCLAATAAYLYEVQWQRSGSQLVVEGVQVWYTSGRVGGANVDLHDQVAVAEVGRVAGGDVRVGFVDDVQGPARLSREVAHLSTGTRRQSGQRYVVTHDWRQLMS